MNELIISCLTILPAPKRSAMTSLAMLDYTSQHIRVVLQEVLLPHQPAETLCVSRTGCDQRANPTKVEEAPG